MALALPGPIDTTPDRDEAGAETYVSVTEHRSLGHLTPHRSRL